MPDPAWHPNTKTLGSKWLPCQPCTAPIMYRHYPSTRYRLWLFHEWSGNCSVAKRRDTTNYYNNKSQSVLRLLTLRDWPAEPRIDARSQWEKPYSRCMTIISRSPPGRHEHWSLENLGLSLAGCIDCLSNFQAVYYVFTVAGSFHSGKSSLHFSLLRRLAGRKLVAAQRPPYTRASVFIVPHRVTLQNLGIRRQPYPSSPLQFALLAFCLEC